MSATNEHVLTTNGMGYFWCSCDTSRAHVLLSLNEHIAEIAASVEAVGLRARLAAVEALAEKWDALYGDYRHCAQGLRAVLADTEDRPGGGTGES